MTEIVFANVAGEESLSPIILPKRRRRLDRLVKRVTADLDVPFRTFVIAPGAPVAPSNETCKLRRVPADALPCEREEWEARLWRNTIVPADGTVIIQLLPEGGGRTSAG